METLHPPPTATAQMKAPPAIKDCRSTTKKKRRNRKKCLSLPTPSSDTDPYKNGADRGGEEHYRSLPGLGIGRGRGGVLTFDSGLVIKKLGGWVLLWV